MATRCDGRSTDSHGPSRLFRYALIALLALSAWSCRSTKTVTRQNLHEESMSLQRDSLTAMVTQTWQKPVRVPMATVGLKLPLDSIRSLPPSAAYTAREKQAAVKLQRKPATANEPEQIIIEAQCDSLLLVAASYSKNIITLKRQLNEANRLNSELKETAKERAAPGLKMIFIAFIVGVAAGIVLTILTRKICQKVF